MAQPSRSAYVRNPAHRFRSFEASVGGCPPEADLSKDPLNDLTSALADYAAHFLAHADERRGELLPLGVEAVRRGRNGDRD